MYSSRRLFVGMLACLWLACTAPTNPNDGYPLFIFGAVTDRTGSLASPSWQDAISLAVSDANAALTSTNATFRVKVELADSENTPLTTVKRSIDLAVTRPEATRVKALITDSSADSIAVHQLQYGVMGTTPGPPLNVPIVCMACTSPAINNPNGASPAAKNQDKWLSRSVMSATLQANVLVAIALANAKPGVSKVGVYASDDAFGTGFSAAIAAAVMKARIDVGEPMPIVEQLYHPATTNPNTYNWASDMALLLDDQTQTTVAGNTTTVKDRAPDVIMEVTFPQYTAALVNAYSDTGSRIPFLHTHTFRFVSILQTLANLIEGAEGTSHIVLDTSQSGTVFKERFTDATRVAPAFWDANSYDSAMAIMLAGVVAGKGDMTKVTAVQVRDALQQINDPNGVVIRVGPDEFAKAIAAAKAGQSINYEGASGGMNFDSNGNVKDKVAYWRVKNNRFEDLKIFDCESSPLCPEIR